MNQGRRQTRRERSARRTEQTKLPDQSTANEIGEQSFLTVTGVAIILFCTGIIYGQTIKVPAIDYEDPFYLVRSPYVHVSPAFSRLGAVWTEPYFANFHPATTTTWLVDRALADKTKAFDSLPFRVTHLVYAAVGAWLVILLYRRLGIPAMLAALGAVVYAVHPIHTEVVAWLSARKDLVSLIFILLSFLAWLWARAAATAGEWRMRYSLAIVLTLLAVLSKPIAVILPPLFVAYEFCSGPHLGLLSGNWNARSRDPLLRRTVKLTAIFLVVGGGSTVVFRPFLARDATHGGWLIFVPIGLVLLMLAVAPEPADMAAFREGSLAGIRVIGPPLAVLSVVFGAGSAWTFWAQQQVGAIKSSAALLPTLNLTLDAMLAYAGKTLLPLHMSASYTWSEYPNLSVRGLLGAVLICAVVWIALRLSGSPDRNRRLIAFGIFWYLIALLPVSNLVATSTKMADRYLFVPTVGSTLVLLGLVAPLFSVSRRNQAAVSSALLLMVAGYSAWSYNRTEVWCGKTTQWNGVPQPDLSLWAAAVKVNPNDTLALTNLGLAYLRLMPPEAQKALEHLNHALQVGEANQSKVAGEGRIDLSPVYEGLADAYFAQASEVVVGQMGSDPWQKKKAGYGNAAKFYSLALQTPSGFASDEARVLSRLAESNEGQAVLDAQELAAAPDEQRESLVRERDELRRESENSMLQARGLLVSGNVSSLDSNYQMVMLDFGNIIFGREVGATDEEKVRYYQEALSRYQEAATFLPEDPRPLLYQGLCYERLTAIAKTPEVKQREFALGEATLRRTLTLSLDSPDYSQALPYRELAVLYTHMNDYRSALDALKKAQQANPSATDSASLERDIRSIEEYLAAQSARK
jgi:hypothetical protein